MTTTLPTTPTCRAGSWACPSRRETSFTSSASPIPTGGRPTGTGTRTTSRWLDWYQVMLGTSHHRAMALTGHVCFCFCFIRQKLPAAERSYEANHRRRQGAREVWSVAVTPHPHPPAERFVLRACAWCLCSGKLWCAKKNKRKRKKLLYNSHRNDGTTCL